MDRIELVRTYIDEILLDMTDTRARRSGYIHLYGVAQACAMIAQKRNEDVELATIAGMLHDIYTYATMESEDHAHKGAVMAREILQQFGVFTDTEIDAICTAIYQHSDKEMTHLPFDEVLIDADVLQHCMYNPLSDVALHEMARFEKLKKEFGLLYKGK